MLTILLICVVLANIIGIAFHYIHKPNTKSIFVHFIVPVNESTWEHLKLAYTPMLILSILQFLILRNEYANIFEANLLGILVTIILIPLAYYLSLLITKKNIFWITILIFMLAVCSGYLTIGLILANNIVLIGEVAALILLTILFLLFALFTFFAPRNFLFKDPIKKEYGHKL